MEEFRHLPDIFVTGHGGKGVVDTCLQIELAFLLPEFSGDEDDVHTRVALMQESDVTAIFFGGALFVKDGCVISLADAVDDFGGLVAGGYSYEHPFRDFAQVVDGCAVVAYIDII